MRNANDLEHKASQWLILSESPDFTPDQRQALEAWLEDDLKNRIAFARVSTTWRRAGRLKDIRPLHGADNPDLLRDRHLLPSLPRFAAAAQSAPTAGRRIFGLAATIAGVVIVAIGLAASAGVSYATSGWEHYSTGVGGYEHFPLPDGTSVQLNTDTELLVRLSSAGRDFKLLRGEALIHVARDERRPFRLASGYSVIETAGAEFDVRRQDGEPGRNLEMVVHSGRVIAEYSDLLRQLGLRRTPPPASVVLAGYSATVTPTAVRVAWIDPSDVVRRTTWTKGLLSFRGETLAEAVHEFNLYNRKKIVIAERAIYSRRVGGGFQATDPESFVAALQAIMGVDATTTGGEEGPGYGTVRLGMAR